MPQILLIFFSTFFNVLLFSEVNSLKQKLEAQGHQLSASEQICRDLRSRESDLQEMLTAKETQLDVLRMRLDEADRLLELEKQRIVDIQSERDRCVGHLFMYWYKLYFTMMAAMQTYSQPVSHSIPYVIISLLA